MPHLYNIMGVNGHQQFFTFAIGSLHEIIE